MEKYFLRSYCSQMQTEFLNLKQGTMTVPEYERKFNKLAHFATRWVSVDKDMADRFLRGLRPELRGILRPHKITNYGLVVKQAQEVESGFAEEKKAKNPEHSRKRKWDDRKRTKDNSNSKKGRNDAQPVPSALIQKPKCPKCYQLHFGKRLRSPLMCYNCQEIGHYSKDCPKKEGNESRQGGEK